MRGISRISRSLLHYGQALNRTKRLVGRPIVRAPARLRVVRRHNQLVTRITRTRTSHTTITGPHQRLSHTSHRFRKLRTIQRIRRLPLLQHHQPSVLTINGRLRVVNTHLTTMVVQTTSFRSLRTHISRICRQFRAHIMRQVQRRTFKQMIKHRRRRGTTTRRNFRRPTSRRHITSIVRIGLIRARRPTVLRRHIRHHYRNIIILTVIRRTLVRPYRRFVRIRALFLFSQGNLRGSIRRPTLATPSHAVRMRPKRNFHQQSRRVNHILHRTISRSLLTITRNMTLHGHFILGMVIGRP